MLSGSVGAANEAAVIAVSKLEAGYAQSLTGTTEAATYRALDRLVEAGVLDVLSESKRNRVWAATDVLAELDALGAAIGRRSTAALS